VKRTVLPSAAQIRPCSPAEPLNAYSVNNIIATKNENGTIPVQFGGCDDKIPNCLPITPGWNDMVRLHRLKSSVINGLWKFPEVRQVLLRHKADVLGDRYGSVPVRRLCAAEVRCRAATQCPEVAPTGMSGLVTGQSGT